MNRTAPYVRAPAKAFALAFGTSLLGVALLSCSDSPKLDVRSCSGMSFVAGQRVTLDCYESVYWLNRAEYGTDAGSSGPHTQVRLSLQGQTTGTFDYFSDFFVARIHGLPEQDVWQDFSDPTSVGGVLVVLPNGVWFGSPTAVQSQGSPHALAPRLEATGIGRIGFSKIPTEEELRALMAKDYGRPNPDYASYYFGKDMAHGRIEMRLTPIDRSIPETEVLLTF